MGELTYEDHRKGVAKHLFYMEDVSNITVEAVELIVERLELLGVDTNGDDFYDAISGLLEKYCPNGYRKEH